LSSGKGDSQMPTAEEVFTETFQRFLKNWSFITALRQVGGVALPIAEIALGQIHADFIEQMSADPNRQGIIVRRDGSTGPWEESTKKMLQQEMTKGTVTSARTIMDAASLVFAQAVLDDCALAHLRVCSLACPEDWDQFFTDKKIPFSSAGKQVEEIRQSLIDDKLGKLAFDSLLAKLDLLFQLCTPSRDFAPINNYSYDRDRIRRIDERRQGIIHRNTMTEPHASIDDDLEYTSKTANYLMGLVNQKYGVQINPLLTLPPSLRPSQT
jgi:hypothetical protein